MSTVHHVKATPSFSLPFYHRPANGEPHTPPESPEEPMTSGKSQVPRFRLPKILKRAQPTRFHSTHAVTPAASEEKSPVVMDTDIPPVPRRIPSPFRAVAQMTEPFPLILPSSPPASPSLSSPRLTRPSLMRLRSADSALPRDGIDQNLIHRSQSDSIPNLRKTPLSVPDFKKSPKAIRPSVDKKLLPSPDFYDAKVAASSSDVYYTVHDRVTGMRPYENHRIISNYFEDNRVERRSSVPSEKPQFRPQIMRAKTTDVAVQGMMNFEDAGIQTVRSVVKIDNQKRERSGTSRSQNDWLAGTVQYCEDWLRGVEKDQRRCQIVQNTEAGYNSDSAAIETHVVSIELSPTTSCLLTNIFRNMLRLFKQQNQNQRLWIFLELVLL